MTAATARYNAATMSITPMPSLQGELGERELAVGTTGWTAEDLDDPVVERFWLAGRYEIVEGVLTQVAAAAYLDGTGSLTKLVSILSNHIDATGLGGMIAQETDVVLESMRVPRVDAVYLTADALRAQEAINAKSRRPRGKYGRVRVVPTLAIESVSPGHEAHDRKTKRRWYAEAGVHHYWLLDAFGKSLECLVLRGQSYQTELLGRDGDELRPSLFPGLVIRVSQLWA
jgi:Putative restriction endonuclease